MVVVALLVPSALQADTIKLGGVPDVPDDRLFVPFGGIDNELTNAINYAYLVGEPAPIPRYQQVYDADAFGSQPILIESLSFAESDYQLTNPGELLGGTTCADGRSECGLFTLRLSTTTAEVNMLNAPADVFDDAAFDLNLTGTTSVFADEVLLSGIFSGGVLTFLGTPYLYDPSQGENLIIDIQIVEFSTSTDITQNAATFYMEATDSNGLPGDLPPYSLVDNMGGLDNQNFGLVTSFGFTVIPEPSTGLLVGLGLCALSRGRRRRSRDRC